MKTLISIILIFTIFPTFAQKENRHIREGNKNYFANNYGNSEVCYQKALEINPNSYEANFNLADAFYKQKKYQLKVATDPRSPFAEGFRTLRTNLQFIQKKDTATTILITSTIASEGKTTVSANLAKVLEMAQYKTLLINLDIRKPTLHKFFDMDNSIGISNYLDGQYSETEIIRQTEFGTLDIITSGPIPENPSELILSKRLPLLFEKLKTMYDYIIIDTAPIGIVTDTKNIMKYTDLNLILLKENFAKKEFIPTIEKMIIQYQFQNVGLILNASSNIGGEYGYGYSYEYT